MTPVITTKADAKVVLRGAVEADELTAQGDHPAAAYFLNGRRCAVGRLFPIPDAMRLQNGNDGYEMARGLIDKGLLIVDDPQWFIAAQDLHDQWATFGDSKPFLEHIQ